MLRNTVGLAAMLLGLHLGLEMVVQHKISFDGISASASQRYIQ
jgi:hypothetical protein